MKLLLVGCGNMGGALLAGWLDTGVRPGDVVGVDPAPAPTAAALGPDIVGSAKEIPAAFKPDMIIIAVKPQGIEDVVPAFSNFAADAATLSIVAGTTIGKLSGLIGGSPAVIRAMPNTPAAIGRGISVLCANERTSAMARETAGKLMSAVGEVAWVDDESLLDPVTAVSGSGPAYIFLLAECLAEAGVAAGLPGDLARQLARATVAGAGEMLHRTDIPAAALRENVTSPGGTTEAALGALMADDGMQPLLTEAIRRATERSRELAG